MEVMLVLLVIVCAAGWNLFRTNRREQAQEKQMQTMTCLLEEVSSVIADFLEHGWAVAQVSHGRYGGTLSARIHSIDRGLYAYSVSMYDTGDLRLNSRETLENFGLKSFVEKYGDCYDESRDALVYLSRHAVSLPENQLSELEQRLYEQIKANPKAKVSSNALIYTNGIR